MTSNGTSQVLIQSLLCIGLTSAALELPPSSSWAQSPSGPHTLSVLGSGVTLGFDTIKPSDKTDENRIEQVFYEGTVSPFNFAAPEPEGSPSTCYDPVAYFGEAVGYPDTAKAPLMVAGGTHATWTSTSNSRQNVAEAKTFTGTTTCPTVHEDGLTRTVYTLKGAFTNSVAIKRTFRFNGGLGKVVNSGLRAYVPRTVKLLHYVLVPNTTGQLVRYDANDCMSAPCGVTNWNGKWFAENDGYGLYLFVIRDASSTTPAFIGIQSSPSGTNYTSIVLKQPSSGWAGILTESEVICFYYGNWDTAPTLPSTCSKPTN